MIAKGWCSFQPMNGFIPWGQWMVFELWIESFPGDCVAVIGQMEMEGLVMDISSPRGNFPDPIFSWTRPKKCSGFQCCGLCQSAGNFFGQPGGLFFREGWFMYRGPTGQSGKERGGYYLNVPKRLQEGGWWDIGWMCIFVCAFPIRDFQADGAVRLVNNYSGAGPVS